ncbi:hypothetical protein TrLO_g8703 [Triparma laevis f. longispina]|nr:hypothetical protein TrLO_g8703 [Triparma laevis f. longispina]
MKACEIALESIPENIIQIDGLLKQNYGDIQTIQVIGVVSSIVSGAFIMMEGNFGFILSKYLASPSDPYYGWISKAGGLEKKRQMFGMFLFNVCYFSQFVVGFCGADADRGSTYGAWTRGFCEHNRMAALDERGHCLRGSREAPEEGELPQLNDRHGGVWDHTQLTSRLILSRLGSVRVWLRGTKTRV